MGEVYLAQDRSLDRSVALKILPPDLVRSEDLPAAVVHRVEAVAA